MTSIIKDVSISINGDEESVAPAVTTCDGLNTDCYVMSVPPAAICNDERAEKSYQCFRKAFHIPLVWQNNSSFVDLVERRYKFKDTSTALEYITTRLEGMGYLIDNDQMVHDYMHFMIMDLLTLEGTPFLSAKDVRGEDTLQLLFDGYIPDLIVKSDKARNRPKPLIMDIYVGIRNKQVEEKKRKYNTIGVAFNFQAIMKHDYDTALANVLTKANIEYLKNQFNIFLAEYTYWMACKRLHKVLLNDVENTAFKEIIAPQDFDDKVVNFKLAICKKARELLDEDGI